MTEPDPQPIDIDLPTPAPADHGPLMTLRHASVITGHPIRVLQRWMHDGILPSRFKQANWPYAALVTKADLEAIADKRTKGVHKARKRRAIAKD
jgi:hypothetical protein